MVINPDRLHEVAMGDDEFLRELIDLYLSDAPVQLDALCRAVNSKNGAAVSAAAHKLKGSCGNVGAEGLVALCQKLETSAKASRLHELPDLFQQVRREFEEANEALHNMKHGSPLEAGKTSLESQ
jgi:HPt (histidine-containing phosphotransfer) domain-containing protein